MADDRIIGRTAGIPADELAALGLEDDEFEPHPAAAAAAAAPAVPQIEMPDIYTRLRLGQPIDVAINTLAQIIGIYDRDDFDTYSVAKQYGQWLKTNKPEGWNTPQHMGAVEAILAHGKAASDERIFSIMTALDALLQKGVPEPVAIDTVMSSLGDDVTVGEIETAARALGRKIAKRREGSGRAKQRLVPPVCRIGTKSSMLDKVFKAFPPDAAYDTYVEPFVGGGAVYWAKEPTKREVINDLDSELIGLYRTLKATKSRDVPTDLTSKAAIQSFFDKGKPAGDMRKLAYGIVSACNRWMGRQTGSIIYKDSDPARKLRNIDEYQERMKGTTILNESYEKVLRRYDSPRTFFYLDPPYQESKTLYKVIKDTDFDFVKLRDELARLKGKWLLSINDSKYIRDLFKGFYAKGFTLKARSKGMNSIGSKDRKELMIANYPF